ncbi:MAG: isocitrate/isopropylmalate family dehydrogenase [Bryobacterales bacterium]
MRHLQATHGAAPKYADKNVIQPVERHPLRRDDVQFMGWKEVAVAIEKGLAGAIAKKTVTYDLERQMEGATKVGTSEFADAIIANM